MPSPTPAGATPAQPWRRPAPGRMAGPLLFAVAFLLTMIAAGVIGHPPDTSPAAAIAALTGIALGAALTPLAWLLAAFGLGRPLARLVVPRRTLAAGGDVPGLRVLIQLALGVASMLWLSHALGALGLLSEQGPLGPTGSRACAWGSILFGLLLLADQVVRGEFRPERWPVLPPVFALWAPPLALTIVAAANPPGALWDSEFGAYDALSYHLQLPKEWAAGPAGRLWPVNHNVYSYLPSYTEAAFQHLGMLTVGGGRAAERLLSPEGHWLYACQTLHAALGLVAAILIAGLVFNLALRAGASHASSLVSAAGAGTLLLGAPWTVVVGSLAYNELAMIAMGAGALLVAGAGGLPAFARGAAVGWLVGIACSAKPTALMLIGPLAGLFMLGLSSLRAWPAMIAGGTITGLAALAPWLVRNTLASGNPVFPFAPGLFGTGHWTAEQVARHAREHAPDMPWPDRFPLLLSVRGLGHEQWIYVPWIALAGLLLAAIWPPTRRIAALLVLGLLAQTAAWLAFTHLQSRFLLPMILPMTVAFGLGSAAALTFAARPALRDRLIGQPASAGAPRLAGAAVCLLALAATGWSAINFMNQRGGLPNNLLVPGAAWRSGLGFELSLAEATDAEQQDFLERQALPEWYVNLALRSDPAAPDTGRPDDILLLGDATALYYLEALGEPSARSLASPPSRLSRVHYHTTWDASPLGDAIAAAPDDPRAWSDWMLSRGIGLVLVNYGELQRLIQRDGYYDPRVSLESVARWLTDPAAGLVSRRRWTTEGSPATPPVPLVELFSIEPGPTATPTTPPAEPTP